MIWRSLGQPRVLSGFSVLLFGLFVQSADSQLVANASPDHSANYEQHVRISRTQWARVMNDVHSAAQQGDLDGWLENAKLALVEANQLPEDLKKVAAGITTAIIGEYYLQTEEWNQAEKELLSATELAQQSGSKDSDPVILQIRLRLCELYGKTQRDTDALKLLEDGWRHIQSVDSPSPGHTVAYGIALIKTWVAKTEFGKAKKKWQTS